MLPKLLRTLGTLGPLGLLGLSRLLGPSVQLGQLG
jgi:hypothetical protein